MVVVPLLRAARRAGLTERALVEIGVAIELVAAGGARTVRVACLPGAELAAARGAAAAQAAHVAFRLERSGGGATLVIGPALRRPRTAP